MNDLARRAFALVFAFLLVTSIPFAAVEVGGPDVSPIEPASASHGGTHLDDFEDGDTSFSADGWSGWSGDTGSFSVESSSPITGSNSGALTTSSDVVDIRATRSSPSTPSRIATRLKITGDVGSTSDHTNLRIANGSNYAARIRFVDSSGTIKVRDGAGWIDTGRDWSTNQVFTVEFVNIDYASDQYDVRLNGELVVTDATFENSVSEIDTIEINTNANNVGGTRDAIIDDVELDGSNYSTGTFTGIIEDFEDDDTTVADDSWSGWRGETGSLSTTSDALFGDHSGVLTSSSNQPDVSITSDTGVYSNSRIAVAMNMSARSGTNTDSAQVQVLRGGSKAFLIKFEDDGDIFEDAGGTTQETGLDWYPNITYIVEFRNIDWSANTYDLYINGRQVSTGLAFDSNVNGFDELLFTSDTNDGAIERDLRIDNIEIGGDAFAEQTYSTGLTTDFEDGLDVDAQGWGPEWYGDTGAFTAQSNLVISGSQSANLSNTNAQDSVRLVATAESSITSVSAKVRMSNNTGSSASPSDETELFLERAGTVITRVRFQDNSPNGTIEVGTGSGLSDTGETWQPDTTYEVEFRNIDWSANTYDLYIDGSAAATGVSFENNADGFDEFKLRIDSRAAGVSKTATIDDVNAGTCDDCSFWGAAPGNTVSGTVVNQNGDPVQNATVQVWGVDYSQITPDAGETEKDQAIDLLEDAQEKTPTEWTEQIESGFTLVGPAGHFEQTDLVYAAVHRVDDWKLSKTSTQIRNDPTLESPILSVDAARGETVTLALSAWDSEKFGLRNTISPVKNDLPGEPIESQIVVETLVAADGKTGEIRTTKTEINCNIVGCDWSSAFVEVQLSPGFYRVYPEGHSSSGYVIKVGDPIDIIAENLKNEQNELTDQANEIADRVSSGKFVKVTTTTDANGDWSVSTGSNVETVAVQAYKASDVSVNDTDLDYQTILEEYSDSYRDGEQLERLGSVYLPSEIQRVDPPASDVTLTVQEMTFPPYGDQQTLDDMLKDLFEEMLNETLAETFGPYLDQIEDVDRADLESIYELLVQMYEENQQLQDQLEDVEDDITIVEDPSDATDEELQDTIDEIYDEVNRIGNEIDGEVEEDIGNETISQTWTFGQDIREDSVAVLIHWSNGSTTTIDLESQYLSLDKRPGLGDQVLLEDYPINGSDPSTLTFEILAVGEESGQVGRIRNTVRNPQFDGDVPTLDAIEVTSLEPGPSDQVDIELHPEDAAKFGSIVSATVTGPGGSNIATDAISSNGRATGFKTSGSGVYHVAVKFNNTNGDQFTETFRIKADDFDDDRPPSAQIRTGPTGRYLVVGDGLESGSIDVADDGSVSVATQIQQDADVPGSIQLYLQSLDTGSRTEVTVKVVRGSSQTAVQSQVGVILHMNQVDSERAVLYREDNEPLPRDGRNAAGIVDARENGSTIETFTEGDGAVTVLVENDPSLTQRALYFVRSLDLPGFGIVAPLDIGLGDLSSSSIAGGLAVLGLAGGVRRWNA